MAKIILTVQDTPSGGVSVTSNPSFTEIKKMLQRGDSVSVAHDYAYIMAQVGIAYSKQLDKKGKHFTNDAMESAMRDAGIIKSSDDNEIIIQKPTLIRPT